LIVNPQGNIVLVNSQAERLFGYLRDELLGQPIEALVPLRFRARHQDHRSTYFKEPHVRAMGANLELYGLRKSGTEFPVEVSLAPIETPAGPLFASAVRDITERKRADDALARAKDLAESSSRELEAFSYSVAHDLRAPLRAMNGFAQVLVDQYQAKLDDSGRDFLQEIVVNARKMGALIDALLSLARLTRKDLRREPVDLSEIVREICARLTTAESGRSVALEIEPGLCANADPVLLRALLDNLLANAWKFSAHAKSGRIAFGGVRQDGELTFFLRDNGAGFDMAFAGKLFAPFQRLHSPDEFPGTGIGLATVQRIVHRHGGKVWAEGKVGEGATFFFTLPSKTSGVAT
jgi:PAS domain S-box-containing protein